MVAIFAVLLQAPFHDPNQRFGHCRIESIDRTTLLIHNGGHRTYSASTIESWRPGKHLVENKPKGELVGSDIDQFATRLFGAHVRCRANNQAGFRKVPRLVGMRSIDLLCQSKIEELDVSRLCHHDVGGFQIAVYDTS